MATHYIDLPSTDEQLSDNYLDLMGRVIQCDGKKFIYCRAGSALTKLTPYGVIHEGGTGLAATCDPVVKALLTTAVYQMVAVPTRTLADDDTDWFQIQGPCEDMVVASSTYTAGRAMKVDGGVVTEIAAAPTNGVKEFCSIMVGGTTVTAIDAYLFGKYVLTET
jgi:hypothetical protein